MYYWSVILSLIVVILSYVWYRHGLSKPPLPPSYGWMPWLGCAVEFGKAPLQFINDVHNKLGDVFTLKVGGERLTFITNPDDFHNFFQSINVDFQQAVQKPVSRAASVSKESFMKYHTKIHDTVKARLAPAHLHSFTQQLFQKFTHQLQQRWGADGKGDLNEMIRDTMYPAVLDSLMGDAVMPTSTEGDYKELRDHFVCYDDQFEYGSQLPSFCLKSWSKSKAWLLRVFRDVVRTAGQASPGSGHQSVLRTLLDAVDEEHAPNYSLLLMWASLANAIPMTFWTMAFILSHKDILKDIKTEVNEIINAKSTGVGNGGSIIESDLQRMSKLKCCVLEAIRLRSPGVIARRVVKSFSLQGYTVPKGDMLMLSPYWAHRNSTLFKDPHDFKPDRWKDCDLSRGSMLDGFVAFGGGRYQCPGRWFALMEIQLFVATLIHSYDISLLEAVPPLSPLHLVGTQQPVGSLMVDYTRKIAGPIIK